MSRSTGLGFFSGRVVWQQVKWRCLYSTLPFDRAEAPAAEDEKPGLHTLHGLADGLLGVALHDGPRGVHLPLLADVQRARYDRIFCFLAPFETKIYVWTPRNLICTFGPEARRHRLWRRDNTARRHSLWRRAL
jgi:hypothetical protein